MLFFDLDGTLIDYGEERIGASWRIVGEKYLTRKRKRIWFKNMEAYSHDLIDNPFEYHTWVTEQAKLLKNRKFDIRKIFPIPFTKGTLETISKIKMPKTLLTNSNAILADLVSFQLAIDNCISIEFEIKDKVFTGEVHDFTGVLDKFQTYKKVCKDYNLAFEDTVFVGDNLNDRKIFEKCGLPIGFMPKVDLPVKYVLSDMRDLPNILKKEGYL